jgi:hypothetical protein
MVEDTLERAWFDSKDFLRLYCDNKTIINIAHNPIQHYQTKYDEIDQHFIQEKLLASIIYIMTKGVSSNVLHVALCKLGIQDIYALV